MPNSKRINKVINDCEGKISTNKARVAFDPYSPFTKLYGTALAGREVLKNRM